MLDKSTPNQFHHGPVLKSGRRCDKNQGDSKILEHLKKVKKVPASNFIKIVSSNATEVAMNDNFLGVLENSFLNFFSFLQILQQM